MKPIFTKYHGPGNVKGSRISAKDSDRNRVEISLRPEWGNEQSHRNAALALCRKMGWRGTLTYAELQPGQYVFLWSQGVSTLEVKALQV